MARGVGDNPLVVTANTPRAWYFSKPFPRRKCVACSFHITSTSMHEWHDALHSKDIVSHEKCDKVEMVAGTLCLIYTYTSRVLKFDWVERRKFVYARLLDNRVNSTIKKFPKPENCAKMDCRRVRQGEVRVDCKAHETSRLNPFNRSICDVDLHRIRAL